MSDHKYRVKYTADKLPGDGMTKAEMKADPALKDYGGTDKFILFSIIETGDGGASIAFHSCDGTKDGREVPPADLFESAMLIMRGLAVNGGLEHEKEAFAWAIWNTYLKDMRGLPEQTLERAREIDFGNMASYRARREREDA